MTITGKDMSGRSGKERKSFFDRLRGKLDPVNKPASVAHLKLPPIADIVARTGRPSREKP